MNKVLILILFLILIFTMSVINFIPSVYHGSGETKLRVFLWQNLHEYDAEKIDKLMAIINSYQKFEILDDATWKKMVEEIGDEWSDEQIRSSVRLIITGNNRESQRKINRIPEVSLRKITAENVLQVARAREVSPLNLIRRVLRLSAPAEKISSWINNETIRMNDAPNSVAALIKVGLTADAENPKIYEQIQKNSCNYEKAVGKILTMRGIAFKSQDDLVREQTLEHGRAILTPDFLLNEPIQIEIHHPDGHISTRKIAWIDVKNYMLIKTDFIIKKLAAQAKKYINAYGAGAFIFRHGFLNTIHFPNIAMLSGEFLEKS